MFSQFVDTLRKEKSLEGAVRRFLGLIEFSTGLESAYLTHIDSSLHVQTILFARNTGSFVIPEGLSVPWGDTLCKRALDESCIFSDDVPGRWGDSKAARQLGVQTFASIPVHVDDSLYGTLCAASSRRKAIDSRNRRLLAVFSEVISMYLERELLLNQLTDANLQLEEVARVDPLTGLSNRRHLMAEMGRIWSFMRRENRPVLVAFIDLDGFKSINDQYGHDVGDEFLVAIAKRLKGAIRPYDLAARFGGDEFVVVSAIDADEDQPTTARESLRGRLEASTLGPFELPSLKLDYAGASVGIVDAAVNDLSPEQAVKRADEAMYMVKSRRRSLMAKDPRGACQPEGNAR
ncbi:sensor domain-containing diguanylate cyclase [Pseudochelatococcus contaminans]|uniref:Diguanylate cyclase n=1 Tax=Pseudochelatococcus contaminans TaxID=1538103 RepID=A0A7W5Z3G1_9HYPH|nr:GGDEF domain-containing protein [Pseudochelatococcus contaminans]MBB3809440.1 diguanylate cyclase [Pseudochelatococcus contaminans]